MRTNASLFSGVTINNVAMGSGNANPAGQQLPSLSQLQVEINPGLIEIQKKPATTIQPLMITPLMNIVPESTKVKAKVYIPQNTNFNFSGLLIGPKGANQKKLEEITGCKILVRGKGSQKEGSAPQGDDNEDQHVLIIGDSQQAVAKG